MKTIWIQAVIVGTMWAGWWWVDRRRKRIIHIVDVKPKSQKPREEDRILDGCNIIKDIHLLLTFRDRYQPKKFDWEAAWKRVFEPGTRYGRGSSEVTLMIYTLVIILMVIMLAIACLGGGR